MSRWIPTLIPIRYIIITKNERRGFLGWLARKLYLSFGYINTQEIGQMDYIQGD